MSINNFDQITGMMDFSIPNTMYFIQILKRRKDNPEMPTGVKVIRNYYIHSVDDMSRLQPFIVQECNDNNARAYINPNRLNTVNISLNTLKVIVDEMLISHKTNDGKWILPDANTIIEGHRFSEIQKAIDSVSNNLVSETSIRRIEKAHSTACGNHHSEPRKKWVVDIDTKDGDIIQFIIDYINALYLESKSDNKILASIPTKNGLHLICEGFNMKKFMDKFPDMTVTKNSPTILYIP
jgi:hypothetical protein